MPEDQEKHRSESSASYREFCSHDIDTAFGWDSTGWRSEIIQLTPGPLALRSRVVDLPGVRFSLNSHRQALIIRRRRKKPGFFFRYVTKSPQPPPVKGRILASEHAFLQQENEYCELRIPADTRELTIDFEGWLVSLLGWQFSGRSVHQISRARKETLLATCRKIAGELKAGWKSGGTPSFEDLIRHRKLLLRDLKGVLEPWLAEKVSISSQGKPGDPGLAYDRVVVRAQLLVAEQGLSLPLRIPDLAKSLRVSERTLYRAFRTATGHGPKEYFFIHRLHLFRNCLLRMRQEPGAVLQAAHQAGFGHPSRLAAAYRRHFGELPSETVKRRR